MTGTPEQESRLSQIAAHAGVDCEHLVKDAAMRLLERDTRANRGEFIGEEEMDARLSECLTPDANPLDFPSSR